MIHPTIRRLAAYNLWANRKILAWLHQYPSVWATPTPSSFPSIEGTVYHIHAAEELWWHRLHGNSPATFLKQGPAFPEASALLTATSERWLAFVLATDDAWLNAEQPYALLNGSPAQGLRYELLLHLFNHATFHRGQLVTMGRALGLTDPPATDFIFFSREA